MGMRGFTPTVEMKGFTPTVEMKGLKTNKNNHILNIKRRNTNEN